MASRTQCREVICCYILPVRVFLPISCPMVGCLRRGHAAKLAAVARTLECFCSRKLVIPSVRILRHRSSCDSSSNVKLPLPCRAKPGRAQPSRAGPCHALSSHAMPGDLLSRHNPRKYCKKMVPTTSALTTPPQKRHPIIRRIEPR